MLGRRGSDEELLGGEIVQRSKSWSRRRRVIKINPIQGNGASKGSSKVERGFCRT